MTMCKPKKRATNVVRTQVVELKLSGKMQWYFDDLCDYRRYIWNINAVDVNVAHFDSLEGRADILPKRLSCVYPRIAYYNRVLAKKRVSNGQIAGTKSRRYAKARTKLQRAYAKVRNIQHDIVSKYTTHLVSDYDTIVIEDLKVKGMKMGIASKGVLYECGYTNDRDRNAVRNLLALAKPSLVKQYMD